MQQKQTNNSAARFFIGLFILVLPLLAILVVLNQLFGANLAPTDGSAIYGGQLEYGYPYSGYMIARGPRNAICSVTYLDSTTAISAGHCVPEDHKYEVGASVFSADESRNIAAAEVYTKEGWDWKKSDNDLSILKLTAPISVREFAQLGTPKLGCNYTVVGYGRNESEVNGVSFDNRLRKSTSICITEITPTILRLKGSGGGICHGDSGSSIYETGTNKVVAVISAITSRTPGQGPTCAVDNTAIAVRLDVNLAFVGKYIGLENIADNGALNCYKTGQCAASAVLADNGNGGPFTGVTPAINQAFTSANGSPNMILIAAVLLFATVGTVLLYYLYTKQGMNGEDPRKPKQVEKPEYSTVVSKYDS